MLIAAGNFHQHKLKTISFSYCCCFAVTVLEHQCYTSFSECLMRERAEGAVGLSRVYTDFHPVAAGTGSSPSKTLNWISEENGWVEVSAQNLYFRMTGSHKCFFRSTVSYNILYILCKIKMHTYTFKLLSKTYRFSFCSH